MQPTRQYLEGMNVFRLDASIASFGTGLASTSRLGAARNRTNGSSSGRRMTGHYARGTTAMAPFVWTRISCPAHAPWRRNT